ncbi:unnamed protein product [Rotaria socialis]|uniref:Ubiquitin thioesterase OTU n=1 Tax=Rotaria socialis TaxID=392032 RepID=A0A820RFT1_9BILA|nr:unnamed protein product [Rotaria socialis]
MTAHGETYSIEKIPADGSCLFHCFKRTFNYPQTVDDYRNLLVDLIAKIGIQPSYLNTDSYEEYATRIRNPLYWGGEIEVSLLAHYHQVNVVVLDLTTGKLLPHPPSGILFDESLNAASDTCDRLFLVYNGTHYEIFYSTDANQKQKFLFPPEDVMVGEQVMKCYNHFATFTHSQSNRSSENKTPRVPSEEKVVSEKLTDEFLQLNKRIQKMAVGDHQKSPTLTTSVEKTHAIKLTFPMYLVCNSQSTQVHDITCTEFVAAVYYHIKKENAATVRKKLTVFREEGMADFFLSIQLAVGWLSSASLFSSSFDIDLSSITLTDYPTENESTYMMRFLILTAAWACRLIEVRLKKDNYAIIQCKLATGSIYYSYHHPTDDNNLFQYYMKVFNITTQEVKELETENHTYYGSYLSEDSDDEPMQFR